MLENGIQIDVCSKRDPSTVRYAAIQNKSKVLKVLLENDAQVNLLFNRNGFSPLMSAKLDTLKWLMYYWAVALLNIDLQDKDGWSALLLASRQGHKEVVNLLLDSMLKLTCRKMKGSRLYSLHVKKSTSHGQCIALICSSLLPQVSLHYIIWSMLITSISAFL